MEPHEAIDRFFTEVDHLDRILDSDDLDEARTVLALSVAKRCRSTVTLLVRTLAERRDKLKSEDISE